MVIKSQLKLRAREFISLALTISAVALLLRQIHPEAIFRLILHSNFSLILLSIVLYTLVNILRAFRLKALSYDAELRVLSYLPLIFVQVFLNNLLPARLGEVAFVYFLKADYGVEWGKGAVLLIAIRMMDYLAVSLMFLAAVLLNLIRGREFLLWALVFLAFFTLIAASLAVIRRLSDPVERFLASRGENKFGRQILIGFQFLAKAPPSLLLPALASSVSLWIGVFGCFWLVLRAMGYKVSPLEVILGATFAVFSKALPWFTIGGIGAHESGWTIGFLLQGWDKGDAIASGFAVNLFSLIFSALFGLGGMAWLRFAGASSHNLKGKNPG